MPQTATQLETQRIQQVLDPPPAFSLRQFALSLGWLLLIPALVYVLTFPIVMIPALGFSRLGVSKFGQVLDYGFNVHDVNADVVIFGDSSGFIGIDPRVVDAELGVKTVVIPNTVGSLPVLGVMPLQRYLAHNRPPRLIVFYFTRWNLDYDDPRRHEALFEGEEVLLRHGSWREIAGFARRKPTELLTFPFKLYSTLGWNNISYALHHRGGAGSTDAQLGHMDFAFAYPPMAAPCNLVAVGLTGTADGSVRALVDRYSSPGTQVRVYLAPIPDCSNSSLALRHSFKDLGAVQPTLLPPSWFVGDNADAHIRPQAVAANSRLFAKSLRPWVQSAGILTFAQ